MNERLDQFAREYLKGGTSINVPPGGIRMLTNSTEIVLFRDPPFQVELITIRRDCTVPSHAHPNIDTWEVILSASLDLSAQIGRRRHGKSYGRSGTMVLIPQGIFHMAQPGSDDMAMLSIQFWHDLAPTFITDNWVGANWQ